MFPKQGVNYNGVAMYPRTTLEDNLGDYEVDSPLLYPGYHKTCPSFCLLLDTFPDDLLTIIM